MLLKCQNCGQDFEAKRRDQKYCSGTCGKQASRKRIAQGISSTNKVCHKCNKSFEIQSNAYNRIYCYDCVPLNLNDNGAARRRLLKEWALEYKGSKCCICGYNKCIEALDFHHLNPNEKEFNLSDRNLSSDWQVVKPEIDKCILLCANCHREVHAGLLSLEEITFDQ